MHVYMYIYIYAYYIDKSITKQRIIHVVVKIYT